jgi:hypothetical protein
LTLVKRTKKWYFIIYYKADSPREARDINMELSPTMSRRAFLGAGVALGATMALGLEGCDANDAPTNAQPNSDPTEQPSVRPTEQPTEQPAHTPGQQPNSSRVDAYVENWLDPAKYEAMSTQTNPGDLRTLYVAFALPTKGGPVYQDLPQAGSGLPEFIDHMQGSDVSLSIGGYGDDTAPASSVSSRKSVLEGWDYALKHPEDFAAAATLARQRFAVALGLPPAEVGIDLDCEYPQPGQKHAFNKLVRDVRKAIGDAPLSAAIPSRDNLDGYDLSVLPRYVDLFNVMTYANGDTYGPNDVVADITDIAERVGDLRKISVGYSTDTEENPGVASATEMSDIRQKLALAGFAACSSFVWTTDGLSRQRLAAFK